MAVWLIELQIPREGETRERVDVPYEVGIPHRTITPEMRVDMFFSSLSTDGTTLDRRNIFDCLRPWEPFITRYSARTGVDPNLVRAIIYIESKGDPTSISRDGALGLMQIMPENAVYLGVNDLLDPEENINAGTRYLTMLLKEYDEPRVLWAWNAGPGMIDRNHIPRETKKFITDVLSVKEFLNRAGKRKTNDLS
jgi:hypothetical protein